MTQAMMNLSGRRFGRSAAGLVYAELSLQVGELQLPDSRWTDFVVVVLTWWREALHRLLAGEREPIEVRFMEGPYLVDIGPIDQDRVHLVLVEAQLKRKICREAEVDARALIRSVLSAADKTLAECRMRGWWSDDADKLVAASSSVRQDFQEHRSLAAENIVNRSVTAAGKLQYVGITNNLAR
jgi:hypothetical protein